MDLTFSTAFSSLQPDMDAFSAPLDNPRPYDIAAAAEEHSNGPGEMFVERLSNLSQWSYDLDRRANSLADAGTEGADLLALNQEVFRYTKEVELLTRIVGETSGAVRRLTGQQE